MSCHWVVGIRVVHDHFEKTCTQNESHLGPISLWDRKSESSLLGRKDGLEEGFWDWGQLNQSDAGPNTPTRPYQAHSPSALSTQRRARSAARGHCRNYYTPTTIGVSVLCRRPQQPITSGSTPDLRRLTPIARPSGRLYRKSHTSQGLRVANEVREGLGTAQGPLTGVLVSHVDFKKWQCHMSLSLKITLVLCRI